MYHNRKQTLETPLYSAISNMVMINLVNVKAKVENYKELGLNSETAAIFNITSRE